MSGGARRRVHLGEGKIAQRLIDLFHEKGYGVRFFDFPQGYWRKPQADVMRWTGIAVCPDGHEREIGSWDTMTDCVRYGIDVEDEERVHHGGITQCDTMSGGIEVFAKK